VLKPADLEPDRVRPLLRVEYDRLVESGAFEDERVELLEGMLVTMTPQDAAHAYTVQRLAELLAVALHGRAAVRVQSPLALADDSEPEPDIAVVPIRDYSAHHPTEAHLVVEVATTSARRDRFVKAPLYARAGIPEYWIVDVKSRALRVCRGPANGELTDISVHGSDGTLRLLGFSDVAIALGSVLPTQG
jgi:Uma2 family endonuclease